MQTKNRGFAFGVAWAGTRVAFDHALRSEMRFDSVAHGEDVAIVLHVGGHRSVTITQT